MTGPATTDMGSLEQAVGGSEITVAPLPAELGGGYEALFTPLARGVVGYGETPDAAVSDLMDAVPGFLAMCAEFLEQDALK